MREFQMGDRVKYIGTFTRELVDVTGTIISCNSTYNNVEIDWDIPFIFMSGVMPENIEICEPVPMELFTL